MAECNNNDGLLVAEQFYNAGGRIIGREITNANLLLGAGLYSNVLDLGSSNLPTTHAYILENKINPEDDKLVQFATPEIAGQGRFSYRTYDNGVFSNWVQLANTNDLNLDGVYVRLDGSNIAPGTYFPNLKAGDSEKWKNQTYLDQILNGYTTFLMAYNPVTDSWQPAPKGVVKAFLEIEISDIIGLQTALNNKVDLNGSNAVGALADAIARRHDPVTLGVSSAGLNLSNQVLSIAAGYGITTTNQIAQFTEAYNLRHTHGNKPVLDTILTLNISQWVNDVPYASESWSNSRFLTLNDPRINDWEAVFNAIGLPLSNLNTSDKSSLINAINEVLASSNAYTAGDHIFIDANKRISAVLDIANPLRDKNGAARISVGSNTVTDDFIFYSRFSNYVDFSWRDASGNKHMSLNSGGVLRVDQLAGAGNRLIYADLSGSIFATNIDANDLATTSWVNANFPLKSSVYTKSETNNLLDGKANVNGNNLTNISDWRNNLGVYSQAQSNDIYAFKGKLISNSANSLFEAGLYTGYNISDAPGLGDIAILNIPNWINNNSSNRYNLQISSGNAVNSDELWFRTTAQDGSGTWRSLWHSGNFDPNIKANTSGYYSGLSVGNADKWAGNVYDGSLPNNNPTDFMSWQSGIWGYTPLAQMQSVLGINTSWNLQQVTNNGNSTTNDILLFNNNAIKYGFYAQISDSNNQSLFIANNVNLFNKNNLNIVRNIDNVIVGSFIDMQYTNGIVFGSGVTGSTTTPQSALPYYRMLIAHNGNVGIGTVAPNYALDVNGTIGTASHGTSADWNAKVSQSQLANYALLSQVPTNNNQLTNGAGYITSANLAGYALISQIPTDNAQLSNGAGYITAASLPIVNNGALKFSIDTSHFASGAFNFSANQSTNVSPTLALSNSIITDIGLGVTAYNSLGGLIPISRFITINGQTQLLNNNPVFTVSATVTRTVEAVPPQGGGNVPIKMNKTRVSVEAGTSYQIDDGNFEGDELVIVPCGSSFDIGIDIRWMDSCMNTYSYLGFDALKPRYFWWSTNDNCWIDVTT